MYEMFEDWDEKGRPAEYLIGDDISTPGYEDERWKVSDLPDICVSDYGRFYNTRTRKFVNPTHGDGQGHKAVKTTKNGERYQAYAHRLIAQAFIPNPDNLPEVRHLNDVKNDNDISNLAWGTHHDNLQDALRNGRTYTTDPEIKDKALDPMRKPVKVTNETTGEELYFRSVNDAARGTGAHQANVCKVLSGSRPRTVGCRYEYVSKEEYNEKRIH